MGISLIWALFHQGFRLTSSGLEGLSLAAVTSPSIPWCQDMPCFLELPVYKYWKAYTLDWAILSISSDYSSASGVDIQHHTEYSFMSTAWLPLWVYLGLLQWDLTYAEVSPLYEMIWSSFYTFLHSPNVFQFVCMFGHCNYCLFLFHVFPS